MILLTAALGSGATVGIGGFTFFYARGASYLTDRPEACANCHVMSGHYDAWTKSSHHAVAVCNDCHTPHNFVGKYSVKALNGFNHSLAFTTGRFPEPIHITSLNMSVAEQSCRYCHADIVEQIDAIAGGDNSSLACIRCHPDVGHLE